MSNETVELPTCCTCPYWHDCSKVFESDGIGQCREDSPRPYQYRTIDEKPDVITESYWPVCSNGSWCGKHPDFPAYLQSFKKSKGRDR
jgi:hypothetical protein